MIKWSQMTLGQKVVYSLGLLVVLAVLGPLAALVATTVTSIFTAIAYAIGIFALVTLVPTINRFVRTMALKLAKANARLSPIETLELDYQKKRESLDRFADYVKQMIAAHKVSQDELNDLKSKFPDRNLTERQGMMDKMGNAVKVLREKAKGAEQKLGQYHEEVQFIKADHHWAQRASGAMQKLRSVDGGKALDEILKGEAIGQVRQSVAEAFAELDMLLEQDADTQEVLRLTHKKDPTTDDSAPFRIPHFFEEATA